MPRHKRGAPKKEKAEAEEKKEEVKKEALQEKAGETPKDAEDNYNDPDYNPKEANVEEDTDIDSDTEIVYVLINQLREEASDEEPKVHKKKIKKIFVDDKGNHLTVRNDEVVTPDDPKGDKKVTELGELLGGRSYKVPTFKAPGRGDRLYMVSTDVARCVGYRDSYYLFQKHFDLFRATVSAADRVEMVNDGIIPSTFKARALYMVTARSIFKVFGSMVIENGKQVTDDYYEDKARANGAVEGAPAAANSANQYSVAWIYDNAVKSRQLDSMILYDRQEVINTVANGKYERDPYTGIVYVPETTQPTHHTFEKVDNGSGKSDKLVFSTRIKTSPFISTGLADVPSEIYEDVVDDEVKKGN
ncbi:hypothetical protein HII13_000137 [Brettanomyces bruxellensis]|nr:hypothetical protein HII13_000137 [Brettanomyces bruxellensis]